MDPDPGAGQKLSFSELSAFFENMAVMIKAGITWQEAVDILNVDKKDSSDAISSAAAFMSGKALDGAPLGEAMKDSGAFPDYAVEMTAASENTGHIEDTLFHLSDYYRTEQHMQDTFTSAIRYPMVMLIMVTAVLAVMLTLVFPSFFSVYQNLSGAAFHSSTAYVGVSFSVCRILLAVTAAALAVMLAGIYMWKHGKSSKVKKALSGIVLFRDIFYNLDLYRFTSCFDLFISSGEMQDEALRRSMTVVEGSSLRSRLTLCQEKMDAGSTFSQAACDVELYDPVSNRMLIPAERSGMLDSVLTKIVSGLAVNIDRYTGRIANTVEPLITGTLMIFTGIMLISLMLPLIGIMNTMG